MPLTFNIVSNKAEGLVISPSELWERYFYGINLTNPDGTKMSDEVIAGFIHTAQEEMENFLGLKLVKTVIEESKDWILNEFRKWSYVRTAYPVNKAIQVDGYINNLRQISYPESWINSKTSNKQKYARQVWIVPNHSSEATMLSGVVYAGIQPQAGLLGYNFIPNYWRLQYVTGFGPIPKDILEAVGKFAAISIFHIAGDLILGAGIASMSLGIDGLSQSISTTSSATNAGYGARIEGYWNDLKIALPKLRDYYKGITLITM